MSLQVIKSPFPSAAQVGGISEAQGDSRYRKKYSIFNVKEYGAVGTGSGGAAADQAGFSAAITAANAAATATSSGNGTGAVVEIPEGNYYVTGGFTLDAGVSIEAVGPGLVVIHHTANNTCFARTAFEIDYQQKWRGFMLIGNSGASAKGIDYGNGFLGDFEDVYVMDYTGGDGVVLKNSSSHWTEGTRANGLHIRNCARCLVLSVSEGTNSFSSTRLERVELIPNAGQVGLDIEAGALLYGSTLGLKVFYGHSTAIGVRLASTSVCEHNQYNIIFESNVGGTALELPAGARFTGTGALFRTGEGSGSEATHNIDPAASYQVDVAGGMMVREMAPGTDVYRLIATLPATSAGTRDKLFIEYGGGPELTSSGVIFDQVMFSRSSTFVYQYIRRGSGTRSQAGIVAFQKADGTVAVYTKSISGANTQLWVKAYGYGLVQESQYGPLVLGNRLTSLPSGTVVFDSTATSTYVPNTEFRAGSLYAHTKYVDIAQSVGIVASSATITNASSLLYLAPGAARAASAFAAPAIADGADGQTLTLINIVNFAITLPDQSGHAGSNLRFKDATDRTLSQYQSVTFKFVAAGINDWIEV